VDADAGQQEELDPKVGIGVIGIGLCRRQKYPAGHDQEEAGPLPRAQLPHNLGDGTCLQGQPQEPQIGQQDGSPEQGNGRKVKRQDDGVHDVRLTERRGPAGVLSPMENLCDRHDSWSFYPKALYQNATKIEENTRAVHSARDTPAAT